MKFPLQSKILEQAEQVEALFTRRDIDKTAIQKLKPLVEHFEIRIPFIGGFSSGKSTLVNALIGEPLLSTEVTPETAVAAELRYGASTKFTGHMGNGQTTQVTREQIEENQLSMLLPDGWLAVEMPSDTLASVPQLVLVDMPGWGSGVAAHHRVIDQYASRSLAYAVVVSAEEGTLRESLRIALNELALQEKPVVLVITKAHKRIDEDVAKVTEQLKQEITNLMGRAPLAVAVTSAGKRDVQQMKDALHLLQKQAESVFNNSVATPWKGQLAHAKQLVQVLASAEFKDAETITAEIETFEKQMQEFDKRLIRETQTLEESTGPMLGAIRMRVENALHNQLESLTSHALNGGNVSNDILGVARTAVSQALKEDFEPSLRRYLERLVDALPNSLDFDFSIELEKGYDTSGSTSDLGFRWTDLTIALGPILARFAGPIGMLVGTLVPFIARLFDSKTDRNREEASEARQHERVKSQIRDAIGQAVSNIESQLQPVMAEQIQKAKESIEQSIRTDRADIEKTLLAKRDALQAGEAEVAAQREAAQTDLVQIQQWIAQLA